MAMTISECLQALKHVDPSARGIFDFCGCAPTRVDSWRGEYSFPALGWSATGRLDSGEVQTVAALIRELEIAIGGREYTGWKGGSYRCKPSQTLYVDNPGDCSGTTVEDIENLSHTVILHTVRE